MEHDVTTLMSKKKQYKVTESVSQRTDLRSLQQDKTADKGGGIVLLNRQAYKGEIARQLDNTAFYKKLTQNPTPEFKGIINKQFRFIATT